MSQFFLLLRSPMFRYVGGTFLVAILFLLIPQGANYCLQNQWDFKVYYYGANAWRLGLDPYNVSSLTLIAGDPQYLPYLYPPYTLPIFSIFTLFSLKHALYIYFLIKSLCLGWLLYILRYGIALLGDSVTWLLFLAFAFNGALYTDILAGNVTIIEQALIWTGLAFFIRKNYLLFTVCIVAASLIKLSPILFLLLLFFVPNRQRFWFMSGGFSAFAMFMLSSFYFFPGLSQKFLAQLEQLDERGHINPATLSLFRDISGFIHDQYGWAIQENTSMLFYGVAALIISGLTLVGMLNIAKSKREDKSLLLVLFFSVGYSLILPRFKDYSYILLLLPTYYIALKSIRMRGYLPLLILTGLPYTSDMAILWEYSSLLLAYAIFALYLYEYKIINLYNLRLPIKG